MSTLAFYAFTKVPFLARLAKFPTDSYVVAMPANLRQFSSSKLVQFLARHGKIGNAILDHTLIKPSTVRAAEKAGLKLTAWTVNDADLAKQLLSMGVQMIYTNDENVAKEVIAFDEQRKHASEPETA
jgi:glycerophosphoryl diester phosphodiesterase